MGKLKVLYICHNHPSVRPGGAETYALELYEAMRASEDFEPTFLAKGGPPISTMRRPHEGTRVAMVNGDPNQYFFFTEDLGYNWLHGTSPDKEVYIKFVHEFLASNKPDIVHIQHTLFFGYDLIRQIRNSLGNVPIIYTLHEFLPICHRQGQMLRTENDEPCREASPRRCHECFPEVSPQDFFMRKRFIQSHLSEVDLFLAPSQFLLERYVDWGIPRAKIHLEDYGRLLSASSGQVDQDRQRNRLGFFGQLSKYKGVNVLLKAMELLGAEQTAPAPTAERRNIQPLLSIKPTARSGQVHLWVHGANLEIQPGSFQNEFRALLEATKSNVTFHGRYAPNDLPELMRNIDWVIVPSIWWENSPLVIQEAFAYGRPVLCSDIGGMAEKVADGVDGLHFRAGNPRSLADTIDRAVNEPGLWQKLRQGIRPVYEMDEHVAQLRRIYRSLLEGVAAGRAN